MAHWAAVSSWADTLAAGIPLADILTADILTADTPLADTPLADILTAGIPLAADTVWRQAREVALRVAPEAAPKVARTVEL